MRNPSSLLLRRFKLVIGFLMLLPWIMGTSRPAPYYQYAVEGTLERLNGGLPVNFTLMLTGKFKNDSSFKIIRGGYANNSTQDNPIVLTDSVGKFSLRATAFQGLADSLAIAVILPDQPIRIASSFAINASDSHGEEYSGSDSGGCSCVTSSSGAYTIGYRYSYKDRHVVVP